MDLIKSAVESESEVFTRRILDTNIYYYIADGKYSLNQFKANCKHLALTAINIYEIISSITEVDFEYKKKILFEFLKVDAIVSDTDAYLREIWGLDFNVADTRLPLKLVDIVLKANTFSEIEEIVSEFKNERKNLQEKFRNGFITRLENVSPGYLAAKKSGRSILPFKLMLRIQDGFRKKHDEFDIKERILLATRDVVLNANDTNAPSAESKIQYVEKILKCYVAIHAEYFTQILNRIPEEHDWDDLQLMKYVREDCQLVTAEKKWLKIAKTKGLSNLVVHPDEFI